MPGPDDRDLYAADKDFTSDVKMSIKHEIAKGATPLGAAKISGISTRKFNKWYKDFEIFRTFVDGCVAERNSDARKTIVGLIKKVTSPKDRAALEIKLLMHQDKEFGARHESLEIKREDEVLLPEMDKEKAIFIEKHRQEQAEMIRQAEKAANDNNV